MESKAYYIKNLLKTLGIGLIGLIIAAVLFKDFEPFEGSVFLTMVLFAGFPFGWMALRRIFGGIILWGFWGILIYYLLMLIFSLAIGWTILCYRLIKDAVQLIIVCNAEKQAAVV